MRVDSDDLAQATLLDPSGAAGFDIADKDLGPPLTDVPLGTAEAAAPGPDPFEPGDRVTTPAAFRAPAAEPTPEFQARIHDTLEKIVWEAFGDVTEKIVSQALERIEKIAWEVIPQLAETLVREEIRRMKGGR